MRSVMYITIAHAVIVMYSIEGTEIVQIGLVNSMMVRQCIIFIIAAPIISR